jgi:hypothetical protein
MATFLTDENKTLVKTNYENWIEVQDRKKELKDENDAIIEDTARLLEVKKPIVNKLFKVMQKTMEGEDDDNDEVYQILELLRN